MVLQIKTTGVEDYIDGSANIKMLLIGGPGVGKTRSSSFWPKPIYADCESGRGSIADRGVAYAEIKTSQDMLDFLAHLKGLERTPKAQRQFQTVVVDTLDGFQRKVKDEWLQQTKAASFKGYEAWGYLDTKMSMLMTRLLNLDYNVIVLVHYKDKLVKDGDNESHELMLQLQGDIKDTAFNDFDLVGWMGSYWEAEEGERVEKRGLTFQRTEKKPFLKDRFGVMPRWVPISFAESDYLQVQEAFLSRVEGLESGEVVGEIDSATPDAVASGNVLAPSGGALPAMDPKDVPLEQWDKATLAKMCKEAVPPITQTVDGQLIKGNTIKAELVAALKARREQEAAEKAAGEAPAEPTPEPAPATTDASAASAPEVPAEPAAPPIEAAVEQAAASTTVVNVTNVVVTPDAGPVNPETGEMTGATGDVAQDQALALVGEELGGEVVSEQVAVETPEPAPAAASSNDKTCDLEGCDEVLRTQENVDLVKISFIKFRLHYCNAHFLKAKDLGRKLEPSEA